MKLCDAPNHVDIVHPVQNCPLCEALDEIETLKDELLEAREGDC